MGCFIFTYIFRGENSFDQVNEFQNDGAAVGRKGRENQKGWMINHMQEKAAFTR